MSAYVLVLLVGLAAGLISGVVGTGASIMLLPVLTFTFGPKQAVPIMAVAAVMANIAKTLSWWREVDWRACLAYAAAGAPAAVLGARTLLVLSPSVVDAALGLFFLAMVPARRVLIAGDRRMSLGQLACAGAGIGFLTGVVVSTGPLSVPAFAAYGLVKGAFIATEAMSSLALYVAKVVTFRQLGALPLDAVLKGLIIGSAIMIGSFAARPIMLRMSTELFRHLLDGVMICSGLSLLWAATR